jgi:hypothetical protein
MVSVLAASAVRSASSGTSGILNLGLGMGAPDAATFFLKVTASSSPTTLDVYLQTSTDAGTTWYDFGHFTQVGAVSTSIQALQWSRRANSATNATAVIVTGDAALAAATVINGPIVDSAFRVKWAISGTSYTFSVVAILDKGSNI